MQHHHSSPIYNNPLEEPLIIYGGELRYNAAQRGGGIYNGIIDLYGYEEPEEGSDEFLETPVLVIGSPLSSRNKPVVTDNQGGLPPTEDEDIVSIECNKDFRLPDIIEGACEVGIVRNIPKPKEPRYTGAAPAPHSAAPAAEKQAPETPTAEPPLSNK